MKIFKWLMSMFKHSCPKCNIELTCNGSHPWGQFTYYCKTCNYKEPEDSQR